MTGLVSITLAACSFGGVDPNLGVAASPRVTPVGPVAKGGGIYKVGDPYQVGSRWYVPREVDQYDQTGIASWYGAAFHGRRTANGEIYDMNALTAGHPILPLPSYAYVTNLDNGRTILVRINDRGPYVNDRLIDLSRRSATELGFSRHGLAHVRVRYAGRAPLDGNDAAERRYLLAQSWYRPNVAVAAGPEARITTGAIAAPEPATQWSVASYRRQLNVTGHETTQAQRTALGGPQRSNMAVGPFASRAEAERMHHELENLGPVAVEEITGGAEPSYRVLVGPLGDAAAVEAAQQLAGLAAVDRSGAAVEDGK
jgi:peptidoglycan lytic transglycosylase